MPLFEYRAVRPDGKSVRGELQAADRRDALRQLRLRQIHPLHLAEKGERLQGPALAPKATSEKTLPPSTSALPESDGAHSRRYPRGAALLFLRKLARLHGSGMPVGDAVRVLGQRLNEPMLQRLAREVWRDLSEGYTLAAALRRHAQVFPLTLTYIVEAGEATGNLAPVLQNLIHHLEEQETLRKKLIASLAYPIFIGFVALAIVALFLFFLLPRIQMMLDSMGGELSLPARILVVGAHGLLAYGPFVAVAVLLSTAVILRWRKTEKGRQRTDQWLLRIPVVGDMVKLADLSRIAHLGSSLLGSGVNTTEALKLTEQAVHNTVLRSAFHEARRQIHDGASFSAALGGENIFPPEALDVLGVGESTGDLGQSFKELATQFGDELSERLQKTMTLVASAALLAAFALVALLTLGIVYSILQVSRNLVG